MKVGAIGLNSPQYNDYSSLSKNDISLGNINENGTSINNPYGKTQVYGSEIEDEKNGGNLQDGKEECQTCKNRKYVDGSNDANVSFKSATHVSPQAAGSAVRAHEGQHVSNAYNRAAEGNGKVVSASVKINMDICPECGRSYVSGGLTSTQIKYYNEENPYQKDLKSASSIGLRGANIDTAE